MNRIFHARIALAHSLALLMLTVLALFGLWEKQALCFVPALMLLVVLIERLIHTTYTLTTDGRLIIDRGRFSHTRTMDLRDIRSVQRCSSLRIGRCCLMTYVLLQLADGRHEALTPANEESFTRVLEHHIAIFCAENEG